MTYFIAVLAGVAVGWTLNVLADSIHLSRYHPQPGDLEAYRPTEEDLIEWDRHMRGGPHG